MENSYKNMTKKALRREMIEKRERIFLTPKEIEALKNHPFLEEILNKPRQTIFIYFSIGREFPTVWWIQQFLDRNHQVFLPMIRGKEMVLGEISSLEDLQPGPAPFFIPEPQSLSTATAIDYTFLPGLAFDVSGGRLGYGGGYYDRFLSSHDCGKLLGLGFQEQIIPHVPMDPWDQRIHGIITENTWITCSLP